MYGQVTHEHRRHAERGYLKGELWKFIKTYAINVAEHAKVKYKQVGSLAEIVKLNSLAICLYTA